MSIARHTSEEQDKMDKLKKEKKQFDKEETFYGYWVLFLIGMFVLSVIAIVVSK